MANEKNYLGMGIIFEGIDKGLVKQLRTVQKEAASSRMALDSIYNNKNLEKFSRKTKQNFSDIQKTMGSLDKTVDDLGKSFDGLNEKRSKKLKDNIEEDTGKFQKLKGVISKTATSFGLLATSGMMVSKMIKGNQEYKETTKQFDALGAKMRTVFDPEAVREFQKANVSNMTSMGVTADQANRMASSITQFSTGIESATTALPYMGKLVGQLGLDAEFVGDMFGKGMAALGAGPKSIMDMTAQFFTLGKSFGQVDFIQNLPTVFENATENAMRFGKITEKEVNASVMSTTKLGLAFTKMGVSQKEAISRATGFADKLADMREAIFDLQAGLDPTDTKVFEFAGTLAQFGGFSMEDAINQLMGKGPDEIAKIISDIGASLDDQTRKTFQQLAKRQIGSEVVNLAISQRDKLNSAVETASATNLNASSASAQLNKATEENTNTFEYQTKLVKANTDAMEINSRVMNERANSALKSSIQGEAAAYQALNAIISDNNSLLGQSFILADVGATGGAAALSAFAGATQESVNKLQFAAAAFDTLKISMGNLATAFPLVDLGSKIAEFAGVVGAGALAAKAGKAIFKGGGKGGGAAGKAAGELGEGALKAGTKSIGKFSRALPIVGNLISAGFAAKDAYDIGEKIYNGEELKFSDFAAFGLSAAGAIPGIGTGVSLLSAASSVALDMGGDKYLNTAFSNITDKVKGAIPTSSTIASNPKNSLMNIQAEVDQYLNRIGIQTSNQPSMNPSSNVQEFIKKEEGLRLSKYKDIAGYDTIGFGHKILPGENLQNIDSKKAEELFQKDFNTALSVVKEKTKGIDLKQNQIDALTSLVFNVGPKALDEKTNLMKFMRQGDMESAAKEFDHFYYETGSGKEPHPGLMGRRVNEASMFAGRQLSLVDLLDKKAPKFQAVSSTPNMTSKPKTQPSVSMETKAASEFSIGQKIIENAAKYNNKEVSQISAYEKDFFRINPSLAPTTGSVMANAKVINNQESAASAQTVAPTTESASVQTSGFDVGAAISNLTNEISGLKSVISTMASSMNVNISLLGDARKIFEVVKNEDLSRNAVRSTSATLVGGG